MTRQTWGDYVKKWRSFVEEARVAGINDDDIFALNDAACDHVRGTDFSRETLIEVVVRIRDSKLV